MAYAFINGDTIKQALLEELQNLLNPSTSIRVDAENRVKHLEVTEGYGVFLAEFIMNQSFDLALRQLACVLLKKYVEEHWVNTNNDTNVIATDQAKKIIRNILPNGLYDPNSKIRSNVAYTISTIASCDWPDAWTELFDIIVKCLGGNADSVHGAMQVLVEFTYDLNEQTPIVGPVIISEIYRIFEAEQIYSITTRCCAVKIFKALLKSIKEHIQSKDQQSKMLDPVVPEFMKKFIASLSCQNNEIGSFALKTEIVKVLEYMVISMPKYILRYANEILPSIWQLLTKAAEMYVKMFVNVKEPCSYAKNNEDDEMEEFLTMIIRLINFVSSLIESRKFRVTIQSVLTDLIYVLIVFMQLTDEQLENWTDDAESFVDDDFFESNESDTVRSSSLLVLETLAAKYNSQILPALSDAISRHVNVAESEKSMGISYWWKIHESTIFAVGIFRDLILEKNKNQFNLLQYLNYVRNLRSYQEQTISPYQLGRCLCFLSMFVKSDIYNKQMLDELLDIIMNSLSSDKPTNLQICAVRAICNICTSLKNSTKEHSSLIISKFTGFFNGILNLVPHLKNSILIILLETLVAMLSFDVNFAASTNDRLLPLLIDSFVKHRDDPYVLEYLKDLFKILAQNPYCLLPLQDKMMPILINILNVEGVNNNNLMQDISLDFLDIIVRHSKSPLNNQLIEVAFPAVVHCILKTDDPSVMQSGGECLRSFIHVAPEQVLTYKNGEGLNYIMEVTTMILNPMGAENTATFVGRLIVTLIHKAGNMLGENIYLLLKAVISKMQLVEAIDVAMSLIIIFAHLFVTQMEAVLNFLSTVPGPTGEPAIQYVFKYWLTRQNYFFGESERKISTLALCKLFEYGIQTKDVRLVTITIREQIPINTSSPVRTRSQCANTQQWTNTPILIKIFKLLINELSTLKKIDVSIDSQDEDDDDDDDDDTDEDNDNNESSGDDVADNNSLGTKPVTTLLNFNFEDEGENVDTMLDELIMDPFYHANMEESLTQFLRNFSQDDHFRELTEHLTLIEKKILHSIQVTI